MPKTAPAQTVLLLGASGFIGQALLNSLLQTGTYNVIALQNRQPIQQRHPLLHIVHGPVSKLQLAKLPLQPDVILHAARNRTGRFGKLGRRIMAFIGKRENERFLQQVESLPNKPRLIYFSGSLMYGSQPGKLIDESFPLAPASFAREYVAAEMPFLKQLEKSGHHTTMLRLPWVIGEGSWFKWNYLNFMQQHKAIPLYGKGSNTMTFIDVKDVAAATLHLLTTSFSGLLNLYHPQQLSQAEWAKLLSDISGLPVQKLTEAEMAKLPAAVAEAFATDIKLHSRYPELQAALQCKMLPLRQVAEKYLKAAKSLPQ